MFKVVVLISGNGSNLQAIIDAIISKKLPISIAAVISNNPKALGLTRATAHNIPTIILDNNNYSNRENFDIDLLENLIKLTPDLIVLAGFMRILSPIIIDNFPNKIINLHPSLLPKYPGTNTYERALKDKEKFHGSSVHIVTAELDAGPVLAQVKIKIATNETSGSLEKRTKLQEHWLYPKVINWFATNKVHFNSDGSIYLTNKKLPLIFDKQSTVIIND